MNLPDANRPEVTEIRTTPRDDADDRAPRGDGQLGDDRLKAVGQRIDEARQAAAEVAEHGALNDDERQAAAEQLTQSPSDAASQDPASGSGPQLAPG